MLFTRGGQGKTATITKSGNSQSDSRSTSETDTTPDWTETSAKQQIENPPNLQNKPQRKKLLPIKLLRQQEDVEETATKGN